MDRQSDWNATDSHPVTGNRLRSLRSDDLISYLHCLVSEHISPLSVFVAYERDIGSPIRIIFDGLDLRRDIELVSEVEIHHPIELLVSASLMPDRDPSGIIPSGSRLELVGKWLIRLGRSDLVESVSGHLPSSVRCRIIFLYCHNQKSNMIGKLSLSSLFSSDQLRASLSPE